MYCMLGGPVNINAIFGGPGHGDGTDPAELAATSNTTASASSSGAGGATVHDHDHEETESSSSASSADNAAQSLGASIVAVHLVALVAMVLHL
ncbi:hypothetical protein PR002_g23407 [Phytophthora rubi]|uniref:Uncharacterized protein n=1 Tax=Phytophthora rubi TaxID=129364 RepID=A0A6A3ILD0_9STRA|nr:hypothetical protein PR002_g23407 [Phytophthora rubi]